MAVALVTTLLAALVLLVRVMMAALVLTQATHTAAAVVVAQAAQAAMLHLRSVALAAQVYLAQSQGRPLRMQAAVVVVFGKALLALEALEAAATGEEKAAGASHP